MMKMMGWTEGGGIGDRFKVVSTRKYINWRVFMSLINK